MNDKELTRCIKLLVGALELTHRDVAEVVTLGGIQTSVSHADRWLRGANATKNATGNSDLAGTRISRAGGITDIEFTAFCIGLKPWLQSLDENDKN
jgi:hypothetical protein